MKIKIFVLIACIWQINCSRYAVPTPPAAPEPPVVIQADTVPAPLPSRDTVRKPPVVIAAPDPVVKDSTPLPILTGAAQPELYIDSLRNKRIGLVVNHTSLIGQQHLADYLLQQHIDVVRIFAPEHGFRGTADAGDEIKDGKDTRTGLPILSLYGKKKEPSPADLADIDLLIFDIQDVGARFYTYLSTLHYVMRAAARDSIPLLILDRPNPNGHYVDGPVLDPAFQSFVGMHQVPIVHGMTQGEYARMVNGEGWLGDSLRVQLTVIPCANYTHNIPYALPVPPSPNLPNQRAIYLYPWLCLFEGTVVNVGRGTDQQFQVYGAPLYRAGDYQYTPVSKPGAQQPKNMGEVCYGHSLAGVSPDSLYKKASFDLGYLLRFYKSYPDPAHFFLKNNFFNLLAGNATLQAQLKAGASEATIRASWEPALSQYKAMRQQYLLYE